MISSFIIKHHLYCSTYMYYCHKTKLLLHSIFEATNELHVVSVQSKLKHHRLPATKWHTNLKMGESTMKNDFGLQWRLCQWCNLNLLTHQLRLIHKSYCCNCMMAFLPTVCTLFRKFHEGSLSMFIFTPSANMTSV